MRFHNWARELLTYGAGALDNLTSRNPVHYLLWKRLDGHGLCVYGDCGVQKVRKGSSGGDLEGD